MSKGQSQKPAGQDKPARVTNRDSTALHGSHVALPNDRQFINEAEAANESQKPIVSLKTADTVPPPLPKE
jgi:hypothetical protein